MSTSREHLAIRLGEERVEFSSELLDRYNVPGPRYTSYPTAPEWSASFGAAEFASALDTSNEGSPAAPLSLYVHVPFCESLCLFCGCNVLIRRDHSVARPYLERIREEIRRVTAHLDPSRPVRQLHWGGGTPTYLAPEQIEALFEPIRESFTFDPDAEIGVEIDPRVTTEAHVRALRRLGFNRVSMGIQDFDRRVQEAVRRIQPFEATRDLFALCREEGFRSINADLIYGLPHQNPDSFTRTLERMISIRPDRIALYSYAHVPWLKKQQGAFARYLPEGRDKYELFRLGLAAFAEAGYRFIGFDHFAWPDDELCRAQDDGTLTRNFMGFTTCGGTDLVGLGVSAISGVGDVYAQNQRDLGAWAEAVDAGGLPTMRGFLLSRDDRVRRDVITTLLCNGRIGKRSIENRYGIDFDQYFASELERLRALEADGLLRLHPDRIEVTLPGRLFLRVVGMTFDAYLRRRSADRPLFSKTV